MNSGTRYLVASALRAANTANARKPFARQGPASMPVFACGALTSELPLHTIGIQAAASVWPLAKGALRTPQGKLGLALDLASWAELVRQYKVAVESKGVLERALVDGLGADYRSRMAAVCSPEDDPPLTRLQLALPRPGQRKRYARSMDISYGEAGRRNLLDIWSREDLAPDAKAPVLLQVHGGAWIIGEKEQQALPLMTRLAERGWVCVAINYRLSPRATWPDHIVDVKRAIAWVKAHIAEHGGDPEFIAITGGSAGGHLSALAALSPNDPAFQPGFEERDTTVQAAVPMYGVYDFTNRDGTGRTDMADFLERMVFKVGLADARDPWDQASPMSRVGPHAPPFFLLHGANDSLVPIEQARAFARMLREASNQPVVFAELPGAQHAWDIMGSVRATHSVRAMERFLAVAYCEYLLASGVAADIEAQESQQEADLATA